MNSAHAADRLLGAVDRFGSPICVGIDPVFERLPDALRSAIPVEAFRQFTLGILDAVHDSGAVPCVKFQSACYERYRADGVALLDEMIAEAQSRGLAVILDAKRGDIGVTAAHYAAATFTGDSSADWLTINSYLGPDAIEPFLVEGRGSFALVRTSNPGSDALQTRVLETGETVAEAAAQMVASIGEDYLGNCGYSALGAVVGATKAEDAARLRKLMPRQIFLVPGYGAQGGTADDVLPFFNRSDSGLTGAIITASRSVIYAFESGDAQWRAAVQNAAKEFAEEIATALHAARR